MGRERAGGLLRFAANDRRRAGAGIDAEGLRGIIADVSHGADLDGGRGLERMMERLRAGDVRALARAISLVEDGDAIAAELLAACRAGRKRALRIGVTGPPGAGKSTLVDQMVRWLRADGPQGDGKRVGVIAVDPSSPYTGGALLGDRIRMQGFAGDDGVFIRSMASRGVMGGLARGVEDICAVMEAAGRETILIETVGVGQDEVEVVRVADVTVLVLVPGMGDEVQSLKAGVMEVADVFVVNKADREGADRLEGELRGESERSVVRTVALSGEGVAELMGVVMGVVRGFSGVTKSPMSQMRDMGHPLALDHLGVAVRSLAGARGFYEALGLVVEGEERIEHEQVRVAMLGLEGSRIELLEATAEDSVIGRFVAKRGEGLHHVAIRVAAVDAMFERLKADGVRLVSDAVKIGAGGHRYFFVHPASTGGVLVEIVGESA
ncbi:MAG: transport system ATPase [Acidobacteriaceae bacterium]|nr:transport system ATPase [Acidobacteriaceae bacterium]